MKPLSERRRRSARETFAACRRKYQAEYIDGVDMSSAATRRGNCFHLAVELYLGWLWEHKQTDNAEEAQRCLSEARIGTPGLVHEEWSDVEALWSRWAPEFRLNLATFYSVEGAQPCFDTLLRYDRVEVPDANTLRIYDAKTHWRIIPQAHLEANWQTAFYLAAARRIFPGFTNYELVYEFIRYGVASDVICKTFSELDVIEQAIRESDEAMAQAEDVQLFPATGGRHCGTCSLAEACEQSQRGDRNAVGIIAYLAAIDRARSLAVETLRDIVDADGPQSCGGIEWAHRPKVTTQYPAWPLLNLLMKSGVESAPQVWLSTTAVKPFLTTKKFAAIREDVSALAVTKSTGTVFSGRPISPDESDETSETE